MEETAIQDTTSTTNKEAFEEWLEEGTDGLKREAVANALFDAGQNPTDKEIEDFWDANGKSDSDTLNFDEFERLHAGLGDPTEALKEALKHFDKNENGKIDSEELRDILRASGALDDVCTEDSYVDVILSLGDRNKDNELDIDELVNMIQDGLIKL